LLAVRIALAHAGAIVTVTHPSRAALAAKRFAGMLRALPDNGMTASNDKHQQENE
jgi:hypothetical protein